MKKQFRDYNPALKEVADEYWKDTKESTYHLNSIILNSVLLVVYNYLFFSIGEFSLKPEKTFPGGMEGVNIDFFMTVVLLTTNFSLLIFTGRAIYFFFDSIKEEQNTYKN